MSRAARTEPVSSARNARIAVARRLLTPKGRAEAGAFLAEGPQAVREALAHAQVRELLVTSAAAARHRDLVRAAERAGVTVLTADERALATVGDTVTSPGILAVVTTPRPDLATSLSGARLVAVCADVRDPGNAGAVVRAADAAGADAVVVTSGSVDPWSPKAVRASTGSALHLPLVTRVTTADAVAAARATGLVVLAADGGARRTLDDAGDLLERPAAWLFGNEAWGLPEDVRALADETLAIPLYGRAESLNLAAAATLCLYASARGQRGRGWA